MWKKFLEFMDADLLKDPKYVNLNLGMSIAVCAEMNFSLLTPFILKEFGLTTGETAQVLSVLGIADIIFRLISPIILKYTNRSAKFMYCITLVLLVITRGCKYIF